MNRSQIEIDSLMNRSVVQPFDIGSKRVGNRCGHTYTHSSPCKHCQIIPETLSKKLRQIEKTALGTEWENESREKEEINYYPLNIHDLHSQIDQSFRDGRRAIYHPNRANETKHTLVAEPVSLIQSSILKPVELTVYNTNYSVVLPGRKVASMSIDPNSSVSQAKPLFHLEDLFRKIEDKFKNMKKKLHEDVTLALNNAASVFQFYWKLFKHNSIDGHGMPINSTIHYGQDYENAFWDTEEIVYGNGSSLFDKFVKYLDVVGHEMTHGVTGSNLEYEDEAGALNEHISDVFGALVNMYTLKQTVDEYHWLIGKGLFKGHPDMGLRSFVAPGTAYKFKYQGEEIKDTQPAKYQDLVKTPEDNGGVHENSGIPNHAFYLFAKKLGGFAWERAGTVWFNALMSTDLYKPNAKMAEFAQVTLSTAQKLYPKDTEVEGALRGAWQTVGITLT